MFLLDNPDEESRDFEPSGLQEGSMCLIVFVIDNCKFVRREESGADIIPAIESNDAEIVIVRDRKESGENV